MNFVVFFLDFSPSFRFFYGFTSGITIGTKAVVMGQTGVTKSIEGGKTYFGTPIEESREKLKQLANVKRIPEIIEKLKQNDK